MGLKRPTIENVHEVRLTPRHEIIRDWNIRSACTRQPYGSERRLMSFKVDVVVNGPCKCKGNLHNRFFCQSIQCSKQCRKIARLNGNQLIILEYDVV